MIKEHKEILKNYPLHESQRGYFGKALFELMAEHDDIVLITADLGYKMFNKHFENFPNRCFNVGASEQAALGIACGMSFEGKRVVVYSITPFLLYRPFETLRTYVNHENIPLILIGSGRDKDYLEDGVSHWADDAQKVLESLPNIKSYWPESKEEIKDLLFEMYKKDNPTFLSLRR